MLIDKKANVALNDIVTIKLLTGEEIIGKLTAQTDSVVTIAKPIGINLQPMGQNVGVGFAPIFGSVDQDATIQIPVTSMAIKPVTTGRTIAAKYIELTTGLITNGALIA